MANVSLVDGHIDNAEHCVCCGKVIPEGVQYCVVCGYKVAQEKKQTNYDRIRNMSVEEMAKYIDTNDDKLGGEICCWYCEKTTGKKYRCPYGEEERDSKCIECIIEWLNSEVEEK